MEISISTIVKSISINWQCQHTWRRSSYNTFWCLLGCSIGDFGTIAFFQFSGIAWPVISIMTLAIINGLITSVILETVILSRQMKLTIAFKTAIGMSLISMISMDPTKGGRVAPLRGVEYSTPLSYDLEESKVPGKSTKDWVQ